MSAHIWLILLIMIVIFSLISGMVFLVLDLQKPKIHWRLSFFLIDITLFGIFFISSGAAAYVYLLFQKQIDFFS